MHDQSYSPESLKRMFLKREIRKVPKAQQDTYISSMTNLASETAKSGFNKQNPITPIKVKRKQAYRIKDTHVHLILRKWILNAKKAVQLKHTTRSQISSAIRLMLEEGVPYRVYRLDIKSFFESISQEEVDKCCDLLSPRNAISRKMISELLKHYRAIGGTGVPRGIAISSVISENILYGFDAKIKSIPQVYYYERYVDDIIIITSAKEDSKIFLNNLNQLLPTNLDLNRKKTNIKEIMHQTPRNNKLLPSPLRQFSISFLGYQFTVYDPKKDDPQVKRGYRLVTIEMAASKIKKMKTKIVRSFIDYYRSGDKDLLLDRIKFLTSSYYVYNKSTQTRRMAGICYGYSLLEHNCDSIKDLDSFLRMLILNTTGRTLKCGPHRPDKTLKRGLLGITFSSGFSTRRFIHFNSIRMQKIQECWSYESIPQNQS